uniref:Inorganic phosphate transporter n=1 Tax=Timspurckia oligopyrenoides TaxID=708627 RepID=A0A7S1EU01_9RHOD|mmetsp:Transcript_7611/g.13790  ORF Transcript_7611/g.13790 Transcript_7611/m.13790 type:complete len:364 (+) Transcript_7611:58-1149(+)
MFGSFRDMAAVMAIMSYMKNVDQDDPQVKLICRIVYGVYLVIVAVYHFYITRQIEKANDQRKIKIPIQKNPFSPPPEGAPTEEEKTVKDYDTDLLIQQRKSVLTNTAILAFLHFKMGSTSPLIVSTAMGLLKLTDEPLTQLHIFKRPAEGKLERPFKPEPNPLLKMFGMDGGADATPAAPATEGSLADSSTTRAVGEELAGADDEDEEEEVVEEIVEESEDEATEVAAPTASTVAADAKSVADSVAQDVSAKIKSVADQVPAAKADTEKTVSEMKSDAKETVAEAKSAAQDGLDSAKTAAQENLDSAKSTAQDTLDAAKTTASGAAASAKSTVQGLVDGANGVAEEAVASAKAAAGAVSESSA